MNYKELVGKEVFLIPTGNYARRGCKDEYRKAVIIKAAKVLVTLRLDGFTREEKLRINGESNHLNCAASNGGYLVFDSYQGIEDHHEAIDIAERITSKFAYRSSYQRLEICKLRQIAEILGV